MPKTYRGARTPRGCAVLVESVPVREERRGRRAVPMRDARTQARRYPLPWSRAAWDEWVDAALARALLVDCFGAECYGGRADLHRSFASDVLAALPRWRWTLTSEALVEWAVRSHAPLIVWRRPLRPERLGAVHAV